MRSGATRKPCSQTMTSVPAGRSPKLQRSPGGISRIWSSPEPWPDSPGVIVAENPVRGLDVQAADMIQERIRAAARNGAAVIVHSSDVDEVLALADRVLALRRGEVQDLPSDPTREQVGDALLA